MPRLRFFHLIAWILVPVSIFLTVSQHSVSAQTTAFTYQGKLSSGSNPANGIFNLSFSLYGSPSNGVIIAGPVTNYSVQVSNGLFTTQVNVGTNVFTGQNLWLEISVTTNGGTNFTALYPLQPINPVPYAQYAYSVSGASIVGSLPATALPMAAVFPGTVSSTNIIGNFTGVIQPGSYVPDNVLSNDVVLSTQPIHSMTVNSNAHVLMSSNTIGWPSGSTLSLFHVGPTGYADINFFTAPDFTYAPYYWEFNMALGIAPTGTAQGVYTNCYLEMSYNGKSFYFLHYNDIAGGVRGGKLNWVWYRDGTINTPMIEVDRQTGTITNYAPTVFQQAPTFAATNMAPSNAQLNADAWLTITNNGVTLLVPAFKP